MSLKKKVFISEIKGIDEKDMTLIAAISTDTVDRMGEVLDPKGVDLSNYKKNPVVLWAHDYTVPPIGKALWVKRDGVSGVISKVQFANTEFAKEIFQLYVGGFMKAFSVGFIPKDYVEGDGKKSPRLTYTNWEMLEYSAVPVPANPDALALAVKKGLTISDSTMKLFETIDEDWGGQYKEEEKLEQKAEERSGLEDLMAENTLLSDQLDAANKTILLMTDEADDLRYKLYAATAAQEKQFSEITANVVEDKIREIVGGVIRKAQGKVA